MGTGLFRRPRRARTRLRACGDPVRGVVLLLKRHTQRAAVHWHEPVRRRVYRPPHLSWYRGHVHLWLGRDPGGHDHAAGWHQKAVATALDHASAYTGITGPISMRRQRATASRARS